MDRASRFLNTLRGERTSAELSAMLGYRADPVAVWIAGRKSPSAAETLRVCQVVGVDVHRAFRRFEPKFADALNTVDDAGLAKWITRVLSRCNARDVATQMGRTPTTLQRWSSGRVRVLLPDFIQLVEVATERSEELLTLLDPNSSPHRTAADHPARIAHKRSGPKRESAFAALAAAREALARRRRSQAQATPVSAAPRAQSTPIVAQFELDELTDPELRHDPFPVEHTVEVFTSEVSESSYVPDEVTEPIMIEQEITLDADPPLAAPAHDAATMQVWQALASDDYHKLDTHRSGWVEARTQLSSDRVQQILQSLDDDGVLSTGRRRFLVPDPPRRVPTSSPLRAADPLEQLAHIRTSAGAWSMSLDDLQRVRNLQQRTPEELDAIQRSSSSKEVLVYVQPRWAQSEG